MEEPIEVRGRRYESDRGQPAPARPRPVTPRKSWSASEVSFGIWGRLACSVFAFIPLLMFLWRGTIFWLFIALASILPAAWWLRETWRRI